MITREENGKQVMFSKVKVVNAKVDKFDKKCYSVQLQQVKRTTYVSAGLGDFNGSIPVKQKSFDSKRNFFINRLDIASKAKALEWATDFVKQNPDMHIKRTVSTEPIISKAQQVMIDRGELTLEQVKKRQVVKDNKGDIVKDTNGNILYKSETIHNGYVPDEYLGTNLGNDDVSDEVSENPEAVFSELEEEPEFNI